MSSRTDFGVAPGGSSSQTYKQGVMEEGEGKDQEETAVETLTKRRSHGGAQES